ncbi:MAG: Ig-like domain-containing protein, partial [Burkholderiales bacterium]
PVTGMVDVNGNTVTFTPMADLAASTQYTATVTTAAQDAAGNALAANFVWSFTTGVIPNTTPTLGAHNLVFLKLFDNLASLSTGPMNTQTSSSTILACVARGDIRLHSPPTDNMGNAYVQQGTSHPYTRWGGSGTALYAVPSSTGGGGHVVTVNNAIDPIDEVTLAVVEVMNGGVIKQVEWNEVTLASGNPVTSLPVTTTGPATLVAFWWGDADGTVPHDAVPNNGFNLIDSLFLPGALVQCAVATKNVPAAGTYDVTWTTPPPTPSQGAQLWLVAVQSQP